MQCRRGYHGGIILKDVSLFVFLPPKNTVSESVQICKFLHSLLSEPLHGSGRRAHAVRNFAPGLLLEIIPTDHILLPSVQKPYVMRKPILLMAEIGVFGDPSAFSKEYSLISNSEPDEFLNRYLLTVVVAMFSDKL